ncbi:hypothetical protein D3C87_1600810 [compost metagenome]
MRFDEQRHHWRHVLAAEAGRGGHAQVAAGLDAAGGHAGLGVVEVVEDALAVLEKGGAFERQRDFARGAYQQLYAEPFFQRIDAAPDDRRRHALGGGGSREAAT